MKGNIRSKIVVFKFVAMGLSLALSLASCGPLFVPSSGGEVTQYVLDDRSNEQANEQAKLEKQRLDTRLLLRDIRANSFIASHKIVFSENEATRGYYQYARWVEPPHQRIGTLLRERFERADVFASVADLGSSTLGDMQLNIELSEFRHDISESPGDTHVEIRVELIDLKKREILCQSRVRKSIASESYSAAGAVEAFSQGVNRLLDGLVLWTYDCAAQNA